MTIAEKNIRNSKIIKYKLEGHTARQVSEKFNISINQIFTILRKYKEQHAK